MTNDRDLQRRILALLPGPRTITTGAPAHALTIDQLARPLNAHRQKVKAAIDQLRGSGDVVEAPAGKYRRVGE